jgi:hypothetical protein
MPESIGTIEAIEVEWIAWAVSDSRHRRIVGAASLGFEDLVAEVELTVEADLERMTGMAPEARNVYSLSRQYGFDIATLHERLRALDPAQRAALLDAVVGEQRRQLAELE